MVRVSLYIAGIVQGVFFRDFTRRQAQRLNIKGWVRNLPDGRVEAIGEGGEREIAEWLKRLRQGPPGSVVSSIEVRYETPTGEFSEFRILY